MFFKLFCRIWNPYQVKEVNCMCSEALDLRLCVLVAQSCSTLCDLMNCSCQAPLSLEFSRQEYWSGLPFPSPGDLPDQESNPDLLHCRQILYHLSHQGNPSLIKGFTILFIFSKKRLLVWLIFSIVFSVLYFIYFLSDLCHFFPSANLGLSSSSSSSLRYLI